MGVSTLRGHYLQWLYGADVQLETKIGELIPELHPDGIRVDGLALAVGSLDCDEGVVPDQVNHPSATLGRVHNHGSASSLLAGGGSVALSQWTAV